MGIKIKNSMFKSTDPFLNAIGKISSQTWGGKQDMALLPLIRKIMDAAKDVSELQQRYLKQHGVLKGNAYTLEGAKPEDIKEYNADMEAVWEGELELAIADPVQLIKRKKHDLTAWDGAAVLGVIAITWPEDDGQELDKEK